MESGNTNDVPLHKRTPSRNYAFLLCLQLVQMPSQNLHNHLPTPLVLLLLRCICRDGNSFRLMGKRRGTAPLPSRFMSEHSSRAIPIFRFA